MAGVAGMTDYSITVVFGCFSYRHLRAFLSKIYTCVCILAPFCVHCEPELVETIVALLHFGVFKGEESPGSTGQGAR